MTTNQNPSPETHLSDNDLPTLHSETTPEGGVIRLSKWPEGYVLWYHGKIVFRSWTETAEYAAQNPAHFDNRAVSNFAYAMRIKLAAKRLEGRGGWQDKERCSNEYLSRLLREHVEKGDPVDVANFCMMLDQRHESIAPASETDVKADPALIGITDEMKESGGHWQPCTGCYDTEDGHPTQKYDYSPALQTAIGCGCHECGGLGAVWWHMTDEEVADFAKICEEVDTEHELKMRIVRLEAGLRRFRRAYVSLMETGRDRIISLGGSCDPIDAMEAADPELRLIDAALATEGK